MRMSTAFPSKYLRAADLQGRDVTVTIERVEMADIGDDDPKPVVYFKGKEKGLVLNKTNAGTIADTLGDETDDWTGAAIVIFPTKTDYQGKRVDAIRLRVPRQAPQKDGNGDGGNLATAKFDDQEIPFAPEWR
jgi:hypothetical protein